MNQIEDLEGINLPVTAKEIGLDGFRIVDHRWSL